LHLPYAIKFDSQQYNYILSSGSVSAVNDCHSKLSGLQGMRGRIVLIKNAVW